MGEEINFTKGTEILIWTSDGLWIPAIVEEDDYNDIYVVYKDGKTASEWINKTSHLMKLGNNGLVKKVKESFPENIDIQSVIFKGSSPLPVTFEKEITKKPTANTRSSGIFKVKFKKDDFLTKKTQDSKLKEQKAIKKTESKQLFLNNSNNEKHFTNSSSKHSPIVENSEIERGTSKEIVNSPNNSKQLNVTNLLKPENFEELLEDIEAEAKICSPSKNILHSNIKQKKKRKKLMFGLRRRTDKRKSLTKLNDSKKKLLVVKLNPLKTKKNDNTLLSKSNNTDSADTSITPPKMKPSIPMSSSDNSLCQTPPSFHQIAHNSILQKIRAEASNEQGFRCPKQECRKLFRKENLLMMHIKHYHAEYTELLVSTPNVTDLATARIEGENVDELSPSYFLNRISQLEAKRSLASTSFNSPSPITTSSMKFTEQVPDNNISIQSENYVTSLTSTDNSITQAYDSKDSGFSGCVVSISPIIESPVKEYVQLKEPIKRITANNNFEIETHNNYTTSAIGVDRHFKIKKNKSNVESLLKEEVINCSCGSNQEDGLMIQCDVCLCWQHGYCNKIDSEVQVPDNYVCNSCLNPSKKRRSKQYDYLQDWIKEGKVASVLQHKDERRRKDENILKQSHQLVAEVVEHSNYLHSLLVKTAIYGQTPDHPKLYLWSEQGTKRNEEPPQDKLEELLSGPIPEKPINTAECRKHLLDEIEDGMNNLEARTNLFEAKTNGLEDQVNGIVDDEVLSATITMLLRDLSSMRHYMSLENKNKDSDNV
ncbi:Zinc finger, PHD-type,Zinc finger, FYVE/PHD-type,Zinc finger, RING/FYVE/PHD-type,Zinc finger, PHD- [Cinara cedri]|uniref:Zinc finger, PHD-type,Zinc finger, FYVE/PHD-type,Zinc finger, RING/FYVE/PHD-type,Zinc finger, PHD n=1 Tax=Cinara cedri TaxID=506608 RepID=A0A5E4MB72_9HEMI|nr:Zinc finger, PHD-type,Zinc finger, FYVE/PHD-type,Zinc finger, RING/FYVE/PHD-type,Zinc finger, PHD- [Cinara cedri]